jgi:hypothetical protein
MPITSSVFTHTSLEHVKAIPDVFRGGVKKNV